jgi:endo-1,4-beta-xylanase
VIGSGREGRQDAASGVTRRALLAGVAGAAATGAVAAPATAAAPLRDHAARAGITYGAAIAAEAFDDPACRALYTKEAGSVTTDLDLKFWSLRPDRATFKFGPADAIVDWASANGLAVRGHTLIWEESNPDWLKHLSAAEIERVFDEHIERVVSRYAGRIGTWDVVNEPFWPGHGAPGGYRTGPWYDALGPSYIPRALKRVRAIDPHVKICINEAHCTLENDWGQGIRPCLARLVTQLRHDGVPLDAVGQQGHIQPTLPYDNANYAAFLHELAANGVDLHITEFDVNDVGFPDDIAERDRRVAEFAAAFLDAVLAVPAVNTLVTWELQDHCSFYVHDVLDKNPGALRTPRVLPIDDLGRRKPLWHAMAKSFDDRARA